MNQTTILYERIAHDEPMRNKPYGRLVVVRYASLSGVPPVASVIWQDHRDTLEETERLSYMADYSPWVNPTVLHSTADPNKAVAWAFSEEGRTAAQDHANQLEAARYPERFHAEGCPSREDRHAVVCACGGGL